MELLGPTGAVDAQEERGNDRQDDGLRPLHVRYTDEQLAVVYEAIGAMKRTRSLVNEPNSDLDACALYYICRHYLDASAAIPTIQSIAS